MTEWMRRIERVAGPPKPGRYWKVVLRGRLQGEQGKVIHHSVVRAETASEALRRFIARHDWSQWAEWCGLPVLVLPLGEVTAADVAAWQARNAP